MLDREEDQNRAMEAIAPLLLTLDQALRDGVATYLGDGYSAAVRAEHSASAAAHNVYCHVEKLMLAACEEVDGLIAIKKRGLIAFNYKDAAVIRTKKVKPNGKHSNYQTAQQIAYDWQQPIPGLPDEAVRLTAGYSLDATGLLVERILIARPLGAGAPFWTAQVNIVDKEPAWVDITPARFAGTGASDFDAAREARKKR